MQLYDVLIARSPVQAVNILGYEDELGNEALEFRERLVARIRGSPLYEIPAPGVPLPHETWVSCECFRGCELFGVKAGPEPSLGLPEGRDAALGRNAGAGEDRDASGISQRRDEAFRYMDAFALQA